MARKDTVSIVKKRRLPLTSTITAGLALAAPHLCNLPELLVQASDPRLRRADREFAPIIPPLGVGPHAATHAEGASDALDPYNLAALSLTTPLVDAAADLRLLPTGALLIGEAAGTFRRIAFGDNPALDTEEDNILYGYVSRSVAPSGYTYNVQEMARFALTATWDDATKGIRGVVGTAGPTGAGRVSSSIGGSFTSYGKSSVLAPLLQGLEASGGLHEEGGGGATLARGGTFWAFNTHASATLATGVAVAIKDASGAGPITTQVGLDIPALTRGTTNRLMRLAAGSVELLGDVSFAGAGRFLDYLQAGDSPTLTGIWNFGQNENAGQLRLPVGIGWPAEPTTPLGLGDIFLYFSDFDQGAPSSARLGIYFPANDEEAAAWKRVVCCDDDGVAFTGACAFLNVAVAGLSHFAPGNAAQVPVTIRGYDEQSADLLQIQDFTPTNLLTVSAAGVLTNTAAIRGGDLRVHKATQGFVIAEAPGDETKNVHLSHTGGGAVLWSNTGNIEVRAGPVAGCHFEMRDTYFNATGSTIPAAALVTGHAAGGSWRIQPTTGAAVTGIVGVTRASIADATPGAVQTYGVAPITCNGTVLVNDLVEASATAGEGRATAAPTLGAIVGVCLVGRSGAGSSVAWVLLKGG